MKEKLKFKLPFIYVDNLSIVLGGCWRTRGGSTNLISCCVIEGPYYKDIVYSCRGLSDHLILLDAE